MKITEVFDKARQLGCGFRLKTWKKDECWFLNDDQIVDKDGKPVEINLYIIAAVLLDFWELGNCKS